MQKINFVNNTQPYINDVNLNQMQDNIENEINTKINMIKNNEIYSSNETQTNEKWVDGKPIYRKVYQKLVNSNVIDSSINFSSLNYETIWINQSKSFNQYNTNKSYSGLNWYVSSTDFGLCYINERGELRIRNNSVDDRNYYITVEYTKTTD